MRVCHTGVPPWQKTSGLPALPVSMPISKTLVARCSRLCCHYSTGRRASVSVASSRSIALQPRAMPTTPGWPRAHLPSNASTSRYTICMYETLLKNTRSAFLPRWPAGSGLARSSIKRISGPDWSKLPRLLEPCWRAVILARRSLALGMTPLWTRPCKRGEPAQTYCQVKVERGLTHADVATHRTHQCLLGSRDPPCPAGLHSYSERIAAVRSRLADPRPHGTGGGAGGGLDSAAARARWYPGGVAGRRPHAPVVARISGRYPGHSADVRSPGQATADGGLA